MMTPKQKLNSLLDSLYELGSFKNKKLSIKVLIDEIRSEISIFDTMHGAIERFTYWDEVEKELNNL
jgi:hypothetical protein